MSKTVRTGNFIRHVKAIEPRSIIDRRERVIKFPPPRQRHPELWRPKTCQWIDIDPHLRAHEPDLHCGCTVAEGSSYCPAHHRQAYLTRDPHMRCPSDKALNGDDEFPGDWARCAGKPGGEFDTYGIVGE